MRALRRDRVLLGAAATDFPEDLGELRDQLRDQVL